MKLRFSKNEAQDIEISILKGVDNLQFSYVTMIKSLMNNEELATEFDETISADEKSQIESLINEIKSKVVVEDV